MKSVAAVHQSVQVLRTEVLTAIQESNAVAAERYTVLSHRLELMESLVSTQITGLQELSNVLQSLLRSDEDAKLKEQAHSLIGQLIEVTGLAKEWLSDERFKKKFLS